MSESDNTLKLDNQLCFAVYACSREITRLYRPFLDELGLTYPQYLTLLVLWESDSCTVKELGDRLYLDSGTLTPMLKRMEIDGLLNRMRSQTDERKVYVALTPQGKALKERAYCIPKTLLKSAGVTKEEFQHMFCLFQNLLSRIHKTNQSK